MERKTKMKKTVQADRQMDLVDSVPSELAPPLLGNLVGQV